MATPNVISYEAVERRRRRRQTDFDLEVELVSLKQRQLQYEKIAGRLFYAGCILLASIVVVLGPLIGAWALLMTAPATVVFVTSWWFDHKAAAVSTEAFRRRGQWIEEQQRQWSEK